MRLDGKVAVITGGAQGMGRATMLRFLDEGASVVIGDLNDDAARAALDLASDAGHEKHVRYIRTDVADESDVEAMIALAVAEFGQLDILFNNAGVGGAVGPLSETAAEHWDQTIAILLRGPFLGIKHASRRMKEQGTGGAIVNTASVAALSGGAGPQAYSAAKAGLVSLTMTAAVELAPHRIRVNAICPGAIATPLVSMGQDPSGMHPYFTTLQPLPVAGEPSHIAAAALFLASDEAAFVTGHALVVDGGLEAAGPKMFTPDAFGSVHGMTFGSTGIDPEFGD